MADQSAMHGGMTLMDRLNRLAAPYAVGVVSRIGVQVLSFAQVMIASRYLGLADFGVYALAWAVAVITSSLVYTGPYQALLRSDTYERDRDTAFWIMAAVALLGAGVMLSVGLALGGASHSTGLVLCLLAGVPLAKAIAGWNEAQLVRAKRVRFVSSYVVLAEIAAITVGWAMFRAGYGVLSLVGARFAAASVEVVLTSTLVRRVPGFGVTRASVQSLGRTALPLWATSAMGLFSGYGGDIILGAFLNAAAVGVYRGGARIASTITDLTIQPLMMLTWSRFTRLDRAGARGEIRGAWMAHLAVGAAVIWPVQASVALLAPEIIAVIFVEAWVPAAVVVTLLLVGRAIGFLSVLLEPTMVCHDRGKTQLRIRVTSAIVLLAGLLGFGRTGVEAAASAHILSSSVSATLSMMAMMPLLKLTIRDVMRCLLPGLVLAASCALVAVFTEPVRISLGPELGLAATVGIVATVWAAGFAASVRMGWVSLPKP